MAKFRTLLTFLLALVVVVLVAAPVASASRTLHVSASISTHHPKQYTDVSAYLKAKDQHGTPIKGVKCHFVWYYKTTTPSETHYTGASGRATCTRYISSATVGYKVIIKIKATWEGQTKTASTWFIPH